MVLIKITLCYLVSTFPLPALQTLPPPTACTELSFGVVWSHQRQQLSEKFACDFSLDVCTEN